jgi:ribosomal protein S18 acetylase RimI-like enzyme
VGRIFVDCIYHKKGYGIALMQLVETYYSSVKKIKLDTPLWNVRTNAFYKKLGYREVRRDEQFAYYQKDFE